MSKAINPTEIKSLIAPEFEAPTQHVEQEGESENVFPIVPTSKSLGLRTRRSSLDWANDKSAEILTRRQQEQANRILQQVLPLWDDQHRGVPNPMIRSGLFGTRASGDRQFVKGDTVASLSNYTILYRGEELHQDDLSVWMALLNLAREQRIGDLVFFSGFQLVKDLGWRMHSESYARVRECIARLKANELTVQVKEGGTGYAGSLLRDYGWNAERPDGGTSWMVRFEPQIAELFGPDTVTFLEWEQRKLIGPRNATVLWLHAYWSSHREPLPISLVKIHELCKSSDKNLKSFRARVRKGLDRLVEIGFLASFAIDKNDMIFIKRAPLRLTTVKPAEKRRLPAR